VELLKLLSGHGDWIRPESSKACEELLDLLCQRYDSDPCLGHPNIPDGAYTQFYADFGDTIHVLRDPCSGEIVALNGGSETVDPLYLLGLLVRK